MLEAIRDHHLATGVRIGMKPAGGIRHGQAALHYLVMVKETLGDGVAHAERCSVSARRAWRTTCCGRS